MGQELKKEIQEIMDGMHCSRNFACCSSNLKPRCEVKDAGLDSYVEITGNHHGECDHLEFREGKYFCKCPLCVYITRKMGHWDYFAGTKRFALQEILLAKQEGN